MYGLPNEDENYLYKYIYIRIAVNDDKRKINKRDIFPFIIKELNLPIFKDEGSLEYINYKGEHHTIFEANSEFTDNFLFRAGMTGDLDITEDLEQVFVKGYRKAHKYRGQSNYKIIRKYYRLIELNNLFGANPINPVDIDGFKISSSHNSFERGLEEKLEILVNEDKKELSSTTAHITEKDLEDCLSQNIELIEEGMTFYKRQHKISGGFIDILAKDANGTLCIIELKTSEDKSIIWQTIHYPMEMKKEHNGPIRMITLAPNYSKSIYFSLKSVPNVEVFEYDVRVKNGKIKELFIKKDSLKDVKTHPNN